MLELRGLLLRQGDFTLRADFTLAEGARLGLIGPSGAGKSTLLAAIAGFLPCAEGDILWRGRGLTGVAPGDRPVSMLFQDNNLFPHLSVAQNVGLGLRANLRLTAEDREKRAQAIRRVGLEGFEDRRPGDLSGGQQSRVALARVLVQNRPLVLLDEPFAALGPAQRTEMLALVSDLLEDIGGTMIMVTHDPGDARAIAPLMSVVAEGTVSDPQDTQKLLDDPPDVLRRYLGGRWP